MSKSIASAIKEPVKNKFNINDLVWVMYNNKCVCGKVYSIQTNAHDVITYCFTSMNTSYDEYQMFLTKEDLLASL